MTKTKAILIGAVAPLVLAFVLVACEDSEGKKYTSEFPTSSTTKPGESLSHKDDTTGSWSGTALTNKVAATLSLSEHSSSVSGSFHAAGRSCSVSGTHDGYTVRLSLSNGDSWALAYGGSTLYGSGTTADGYHYSVSFKRE